MGVELRRAEVGVAEHLLDASQVGSSFQQVGRKRVAEDVGVDPLGVESGLAGQLPEDQERTCAREGPSLSVQEEVGAMAAVEIRSPPGEVAAERFRRLTPQRNDPLLVALPDAAHEAVVEVDPSS